MGQVVALAQPQVETHGAGIAIRAGLGELPLNLALDMIKLEIAADTIPVIHHHAAAQRLVERLLHMHTMGKGALTIDLIGGHGDAIPNLALPRIDIGAKDGAERLRLGLPAGHQQDGKTGPEDASQQEAGALADSGRGTRQPLIPGCRAARNGAARSSDRLPRPSHSRSCTRPWSRSRPCR